MIAEIMQPQSSLVQYLCGHLWFFNVLEILSFIMWTEIDRFYFVICFSSFNVP